MINSTLVNKNYFVIDYYEFDKLVKEHILNSENFECVTDFQMYNNTAKVINNVAKSQDDVKINEWSSVYSYIQYLVNKEVLPEGNYLIEASW